MLRTRMTTLAGLRGTFVFLSKKPFLVLMVILCQRVENLYALMSMQIVQDDQNLHSYHMLDL